MAAIGLLLLGRSDIKRITYKGWLILLVLSAVLAFQYLRNDAQDLKSLTMQVGTVCVLAAYALPFILAAVFGFFIVKSWWKNDKGEK
jgi:hypothetical protein